jgi:putative transposase
MARPLRVEFEGALYHLLARGNDRQSIFENDQDRERFLRLLAESADRFQGVLHAFVLMGNHFHLLATTRRANLSRWMHWLMVTYSVYFNRRHHRIGHLLQGRYKSLLVEEGRYLLELSRYLHLNPVRGVVLGRGTPGQRRERLRNFPWSTYRGYAGLGKHWPFVEQELLLGEVNSRKRGRHLRYRRFVEEGLVREIDNPFEAQRWQTFLGSESFVQKILGRLQGDGRRRREMHVQVRGPRPLIPPQAIIARVARSCGMTAARLMGRGDWGLAARNVAMWLAWERCELSLGQIGELFGGLDYAATAQRIRRARAGLTARQRKKWLHQMSNIKI